MCPTWFKVSILVTTVKGQVAGTRPRTRLTPSVLRNKSEGLVPKIQTSLNSWDLSQGPNFTRWDLSPQLDAGTSPLVCAGLQGIDHFTVVCSVTWSLNGSEARGDLVLIQTSLLLLCKSSCSNANEVYLHHMQWGLYQSKVTFSLAAIQRPGLLAHNCKMAYSTSKGVQQERILSRKKYDTRYLAMSWLLYRY